MVAAYVRKPVVSLPPHRLSTADLIKLLERFHADEPKLSAYARMIANTQVGERYYVRNPELVLGVSDVGREIRESLDVLGELVVDSARRALAEGGLRPDQIDAVVVASVAGGFRMPGFDIRVINDLGLRADVRRSAETQKGCVGGVWALGRAWELLQAYPHYRVLVVCADAFSLGLQPTDTDRAAFIFNGLAGDLAAATIVCADEAPGLRIDHPPFEYTLAGTEPHYRTFTDSEGVHFTSREDGPEAVAKVIPELAAWFGLGTEDAWPLDFTVAHTGAPKILRYVAEGLMLTEHDLRHSYRSLSEFGNTTACSVIDVLRRTHDDPPASGTRGGLVAFGPGVAGAGLRVTWA